MRITDPGAYRSAPLLLLGWRGPGGLTRAVTALDLLHDPVSGELVVVATDRDGNQHGLHILDPSLSPAERHRRLNRFVADFLAASSWEPEPPGAPQRIYPPIPPDLPPERCLVNILPDEVVNYAPTLLDRAAIAQGIRRWLEVEHPSYGRLGTHPELLRAAWRARLAMEPADLHTAFDTWFAQVYEEIVSA